MLQATQRYIRQAIDHAASLSLLLKDAQKQNIQRGENKIYLSDFYAEHITRKDHEVF